MIHRPAFKAHLRAVSAPGEGVLLLTEDAARVLRGARVERIVSLIDGERSADDIVAAAEEMDPALAWSVLMRLESGGLIEDSSSGRDRRSAAFWLTLGLDPGAAAAALERADVRVCAPSQAHAERFGDALRQFGIDAAAFHTIDHTFDSVGGTSVGGRSHAGAPAGLDVVLAEDYLADDLLRIHDLAQDAGRRCLLLRPFGASLWVGPLFDPDEAGCLHCLRRRLGHLRPANRMARHHDPARGTREPLGSLTGTEAIAFLLAAAEIAKELTGSPPRLAGVVRTLDFRDWSFQSHRMIPHPACTRCAGTPAAAMAAPEFEPIAIAFDADGGFRSVAPQETLRRYGHLVSPLVGIVPSLIPRGDAEQVGHTFSIVHDRPLAEEPTRMAQLLDGYRVRSAGKGMTEAQAKASALCEAVERYSALRHGTECTARHAYRDVAADAVHPNAVMHYSDAQYRSRHETNARRVSEAQFVPRRLDPDERIDWTPVWSLTEGRRKLLPTDLLYLDPAAARREDRVAAACSNGCAAGNTLEEAVLQGFLELVERDAVAIWWYNRLRRPAIDLASFDDRWLRGVRARYRALGREVVALDLTTDLNIPVAAGISHREDAAEERIVLGFGCHFDPRIALQRALTESVQMLRVALAGDDRHLRSVAGGWLTRATRADHPYLVPDEAAPPRTRGDLPEQRFDDLLEGIEACRRTVERPGMEMLVLDQTRADSRMPVARVVVPGLRHFWPRFAPGRLYDAPVRMGCRSSPLPEHELNPVSSIF